MWSFRRVLLGSLVPLIAVVLSGCAQPDTAPVTTAAADLTGVAFDVHQEPG